MDMLPSAEKSKKNVGCWHLIVNAQLIGLVNLTNVIPIQSLNDISPSDFPIGSCVLFDLDDTAFIFADRFMRDAYPNFGVKTDFLKEVKIKHGTKRLDFVFDKAPYQFVEPQFAEILSFLEQKQIDTLGFTARRTGKEFADLQHTYQNQTIRILDRLGIKFHSKTFKDTTYANFNPKNPELSKHIVYTWVEHFELQHDAMIKDAVLFANNLGKGIIFDIMLKGIESIPDHFIMLDDNLNNLLEVQKTVDGINQKFGTQMKFTGWHYTAAKNLDNSINDDIARQQKSALLADSPLYLPDRSFI